jgi:hypothetical protein
MKIQVTAAALAVLSAQAFAATTTVSQDNLTIKGITIGQSISQHQITEELSLTDVTDIACPDDHRKGIKCWGSTGQTLAGQPLEAFVIKLLDERVVSINASFEKQYLEPIDFALAVKFGVPDYMGRDNYKIQDWSSFPNGTLITWAEKFDGKTRGHLRANTREENTQEALKGDL